MSIEQENPPSFRIDKWNNRSQKGNLQVNRLKKGAKMLLLLPVSMLTAASSNGGMPLAETSSTPKMHFEPPASTVRTLISI